MTKVLTNKDIEIMKKPIKSALIGCATVVAVAGTVLIPAASFAAVDTKSTTIDAVIASVISMTTSGTVTINITPTGVGSASSSSDTVSVSTNRAAGYNLKISDTDTTLTLQNGANTLAAASGTYAAPAALGNNTWGWRIDGAGTFGAGPTSAQTNQASLSGTWAAIPSSASPTTVKTTATTATNDTTTVWYGAMADTTKVDGTYTDSVTYTATTN
jgi:hypothetical protein